MKKFLLTKNIQNLISLKNGTINTNYKKDYLEIYIDSGYAFLNKNYQNNKNDKITYQKLLKTKIKILQSKLFKK